LLDQVVVVDKETLEVLLELALVVLLDQVVAVEHKMLLHQQVVVVVVVDLHLLDLLHLLLEIQFKVLLVVLVLV
jgi:hypothetical protein